MWGDAAAAALGVTDDAWWAAVSKSPWFTFDGPGRAGWTLTAFGREEALKLTQVAA